MGPLAEAARVLQGSLRTDSGDAAAAETEDRGELNAAMRTDQVEDAELTTGVVNRGGATELHPVEDVEDVAEVADLVELDGDDAGGKEEIYVSNRIPVEMYRDKKNDVVFHEARRCKDGGAW